jgi:hypothetical protein
VAGERSADDIQRDIEQARASLAIAVDQLAYRTSPKRVVANAKVSLRQRAQSPAGKAVIGGVGALIAIFAIRKIVKR